ncbi:MAG: hypothetical protein ACYS8W_09950 [Planctomycetota bacterium]
MNVREETFTRRKRLVFGSEVLVGAGQKVGPETVVAKTMLPLPRLFFLSAFRILPKGDPAGYKGEWLVKRGDEVESGVPLVRFYPFPDDSCAKGDVVPGGARITDPRVVREFKNPFTGIIEEIREDVGTVLLREKVDYSEREAVVYAGQQIGVKGRRLKRFLRREVGEFVEKGGLLAMRVGASDEGNAFLVDNVRAPIAGVVTEINVEDGSVRLERKIEEIELQAGVFGEVSAIEDNGIDISFRGRRISGLCGIGGESFGEIRSIKPNSSGEINPANILESDRGKILVCGAYASFEVMEKAADCGIAGMVAGSADHLDLCDFIGEDFAVAITGKEKVPFPIILMCGFGHMPLDDEAKEKCDLLSGHEGAWALINGTTHVRAGVVRPEIIIMSEDD